jgi:hypothetical protein
MTKRLHPDGRSVDDTPEVKSGSTNFNQSLEKILERRARLAEAYIAELEIENERLVKENRSKSQRLDGIKRDRDRRETRIAELERDLAWVRSGGDLKMKKNGGGLP